MRQKSGITPAEAGVIIGAPAQFVRVAMQQNVINIGCAMKYPGSPRWTYYISPKLLREYTGKDVEAELVKIREKQESRKGEKEI